MITAPSLEASPLTGPYDFLVVANRLPVDEVSTGDGGRGWRRSPGGLVTALFPVMSARSGAWIGWHGAAGPAPDPFEHEGIDLHPVGLTPAEVDDYYEGQSNATIWPLYHDAVEQPVFHRRWRNAYRTVNERFAHTVAALAGPGATVWIHDYHLQLVPGLLRELRSDLRIGFFLHIPFPPVELFMQMPLRAEVLQGLLGADLVGFQHPLAAANFRQLAEHLLGAQSTGSEVSYEGRSITAAAFPISIDMQEIEALVAEPAVRRRAAEIRAELGNPHTLILGVDRLDYTKGIENRLTAYGELLADGGLDSAGTVMMQVAVPTRQRVEQYQQLRERVERTVGRINGEHADVGRPAVHYLHQSFQRRELVSLYLAADVMAVTPLRDGMNLVAKEYLATRTEDEGFLILSEFAGAAAELPQARLVNPHDVEQLKAAMMEAVSAPQPSPAIRAMRSHLRANDVNRWARAFLGQLEQATPQVVRQHGGPGRR